MIKEIYEKNIEFFIPYATYKEDIVASIEAADSSNVYLEEGILALEKENRAWYFNSRYNSKECANVFAKQCEDMKSFSIITVFGFGTGEYIRTLLQTTKAEKIVVYEPSEAIFKSVIENIDVSDLLSNRRILLAVGDKSLLLFQEYLEVFLEYAKADISKFICLPNYQVLYKEIYERIVEIYRTKQESLLISRNTMFRFRDIYVNNSLGAILDMIKNYSVSQLIECFKGIDNEEKTAVLVSAGPSLDKNVHLLKKLKGKCLIMVVDTALKTVLRQGVEPDITITIDGVKYKTFFEHEGFTNIPMIVCMYSNSQLFDIHKGKRFYFVTGNDYIYSVYSKYDKGSTFLESAGSVANSAFSTLVEMGYKNIILIGQDLAYPNGQIHTKEAYDGKEEGIREESKYFYVKDIYGNDILTEGNMNHYRKWFETQIRKKPKLNVIDATEGGALIEGTKIMTFAEAIESIAEQSINAKEMIDSLQPAFSEKEQAELLQEIKDTPERIEEIKKKLKDGIRKYQRLEELASHNKFHTSEYQKVVQATDEMSKWIVSDPLLNLAQIYNIKTEYEVQDKAYKYDENASQHAKIKEITDNGIKMLEAYIDGVTKLSVDWEEALKNIE